MPQRSLLWDDTTLAEWKRVRHRTLPGQPRWIDDAIRNVVPPTRTTKIEARLADEMVRFLQGRVSAVPFATIVEALQRKADDARHLGRCALRTVSRRVPARWPRILQVWRAIDEQGRAEAMNIWATPAQRDSLLRAASRDASPRVRIAAIKAAFWTQSRPLFESVAKRISKAESSARVVAEIAYFRALWEPGYVSKFDKPTMMWNIEYLWDRDNAGIASGDIPDRVVQRWGLAACVEHLRTNSDGEFCNWERFTPNRDRGDLTPRRKRTTPPKDRPRAKASRYHRPS